MRKALIVTPAMKSGTTRMKTFTTRLKLVEASFRVNLKYLNSEAEPGLIFFLAMHHERLR
jgi:hypothetical protein